jgi:hypothetical protein
VNSNRPDHSPEDEGDVDQDLQTISAIRDLPRRTGLGGVELIDVGSLFGSEEEWVALEDFIAGYL